MGAAPVEVAAGAASVAARAVGVDEADRAGVGRGAGAQAASRMTSTIATRDKRNTVIDSNLLRLTAASPG
jgi:hypothetical protein